MQTNHPSQMLSWPRIDLLPSSSTHDCLAFMPLNYVYSLLIILRRSHGLGLTSCLLPALMGFRHEALSDIRQLPPTLSWLRTALLPSSAFLAFIHEARSDIRLSPSLSYVRPLAAPILTSPTLLFFTVTLPHCIEWPRRASARHNFHSQWAPYLNPPDFISTSCLGHRSAISKSVYLLHTFPC